MHLRSPLCQREAISRTFRRAPIAANLDSMCFAFIGCDFWFQTEAHRTKCNIQLRRSDSDDSIWFVALAIEQLALVTDNRTSTCIVPLRRRVPHVFGHGSIIKMVS